MIFASLILQAQIELPAGFYALSELPERLKPTVEVKIDPSAQEDIYALRLKSKTWDEVRNALTSDGRLAIAKNDEGVWIVKRDGNNADAERRQLNQYSKAVQSTIYEVYGRASKRAAEFLRLPNDMLDSDLSNLPVESGSRLTDAANELIRLCVGTRDRSFTSLGMPAIVTAPDRTTPFSTLERRSLYNARFGFFHDGDLSQFRIPFGSWANADAAQRETLSRNFEVLSKLCLDPLTLSSSFRLLGRSPGNPDLIFSFGQEAIAPTRFPVQVLPERVLTPTEMDALKAREKATGEAGEALAKESPLPVRTMRVSEALLRIAEDRDFSLVYQVPAFTDWPLDAAQQRSIPRVIRDSMSRLDRRFLREGAFERAAITDGGSDLGLQLPTRLTLASAGDVFVVRNEYRFLDGFQVGNGALPLRLSNEVLAGRKVSFEGLAKEVAGLKMSGWKSSLFSSGFLDYCNPVTFRPIAETMEASPKLRAFLKSGGKPNASIQIPDLEERARAILIQSMKMASGYSDATSGLAYDPICSALSFQDLNKNGKIAAALESDGLKVTIWMENRLIWSTWARNIQL